MTYLHEHKPPIVHGDLKPVCKTAPRIALLMPIQGNILIDDAGKPRICDFGLSRVFLEESDNGMTTTSEHTGTARYLAPELVASDTSVPPTFPSDVYALGSIGLEVSSTILIFSPHLHSLHYFRLSSFKNRIQNIRIICAGKSFGILGRV